MNSGAIGKSTPTARIQFSIRAMLIVTLVIASLTASCVYLNRTFNSRIGYGPYESFDDWPLALQSLVGDDQELQKHVTPFGLSGGFDHKSIWKIKSGSPVRDAISHSNELIRVSKLHPKAPQLIGSLPDSWRMEIQNNWNWYATPGYGTAHIECLDLYLIADNPDTNESIVLHENIF